VAGQIAGTVTVETRIEVLEPEGGA
jgi:hypothetical protein